MQKIEKALKIVFDEVGNNYVYPSGEWITDEFGDSKQFRNPYFGQTPKAVKFTSGTQEQLISWMTQTKDKYPLVWLIHPTPEDHTNDAGNFFTYSGARLVFAMNSKPDPLVQTRIQTTRFILDQIIEVFEALMRSSRFKAFIFVSKTANIRQNFISNYSDNKKDGKTIDVWDAITYECTIHFMPDCLPKV